MKKDFDRFKKKKIISMILIFFGGEEIYRKIKNKEVLQ